jgi:hypothetical protein
MDDEKGFRISPNPTGGHDIYIDGEFIETVQGGIDEAFRRSHELAKERGYGTTTT